MNGKEVDSPATAFTGSSKPFDIANALLQLSLEQPDAEKATEATDMPTPFTPQNKGVETLSSDGPHLRTPQPLASQCLKESSSCSSTQPLESKQACLVILQEACNQHKFSRKVRQKDLESIVERPERSRAAILGIINAKTHLDTSGIPSLDIFHSRRSGDLGDAAVEDVHGHIYPQDLLRTAKAVEEKLARNELEISPELPYGDLYLAPRSLEALNGCIGALYDGMDAILAEPTLSPEMIDTSHLHGYQTVHLCVRPPGHHAAQTSPCGFCWINNVHVAIAYARRKHGIKRAAILDFDLHHGDGSQSIAWTLNEARPNAIGYYSLHDIYSYPCESGNVEKIREASVSIAAHGHNIHNETLVACKDSDEFDHLYRTRYARLLAAAEQYLADGYAKGEKSIVCISAGYDASEYESSSMQRHAVCVPTAFYERFTADAVRLAKKYSHGKVFSVMEGGYGDRAITSASTAHMLGLVPSDQSDATGAASYALERLKDIEKHFPGKNKGVRRSNKVESSTEPWIQYMTYLHEKHLSAITTTNSDTKHHDEDAALLDLQRMTLRERKPKSTPVATPRAPKATPKGTPAVKDKVFPVIRKFKIKMPEMPELPSSVPSASVSVAPSTPTRLPDPTDHDTGLKPTDHTSTNGEGTPTPSSQSGPQPHAQALNDTTQQRDIYDFPE